MQLIKRIPGDVTKIERGVICHGVNCLGIMGAGVALAIRKKWPFCFNDYIHHISSNGGTGPHLLGQVALSLVGDDIVVAHCFTQHECSAGKVNATADSIGTSINTAIEYAKLRGLPIYMPEIGGLRGGLNFEKDVLPQLSWSAYNNEYPITILTFKE